MDLGGNGMGFNPLKYPNIACECGCIVWNQGRLIKRVPGIEVGTGAEDQIIDMPVFYCAKCGKILPEDVKMYKLDESKTVVDKENDDKPHIIL